VYETIPKSQAFRVKDHIRIRHQNARWIPTTEEEARKFVRACGISWKWAKIILDGDGVVTLTWGYLRKRLVK